MPQVFFIVNIYTPQRTFQQVADPFCRVVDNSSGSELCRYSLKDAGSESGLIIAKISREVGGRWGFHALGLPCRGRTYKDAMPQVRSVCNIKTSSLMLRTQTSGELGGVPIVARAEHPRIVEERPLIPGGKQPLCCPLQ